MIGLGFIVALIIYIVVALAATVLVPRYLFETPRARTVAGIVVLLTFVLIPTWDIVPGRLYFDHLCKTEGGLKIYKTVEGVDGFYGEDIGSGSALHFLKSLNYSYVEGRELDQPYRFTLNKDGGLNKTKIERSSAPYVMVRQRHESPLNIKRYEDTISNAQTKDIIATKTDFYLSGNWIQVRSSPLLGGGEYCSKERITSTTFLQSALKPYNDKAK